MKVICGKTNIEFTASGFNKFNITSVHPLFSASFSTLLEVAEDWRAGKLTQGERRVLFVALLNSTGLCKFETAATPTDATVQKYMEYLLVTVNWKHAVGDRIPLSQVAINHSTRELENIGNWLSNWNNTQKEFATGAHMQSVRDRIAKSQERLLRLLRNNKQDTQLYKKHLAAWFLAASNAPKPLHELWTNLFLLERPEIWNASLADLEELKEHCEENVPMNSTYAMATYNLLCSLVTDRKEGVLGALSGNLETYTIVQEDTEIYNMEVAASQATDEAPKPENYETRTAYLIARARWKIKLSQFATVSIPVSTVTDTDNDTDTDTKDDNHQVKDDNGNELAAE